MRYAIFERAHLYRLLGLRTALLEEKQAADLSLDAKALNHQVPMMQALALTLTLMLTLTLTSAR